MSSPVTREEGSPLPAQLPGDQVPAEPLSNLLGVQAIVDQNTLEEDVMRQADAALREKDIANEERRLDRARKAESQLQAQITATLDKMERSRNALQRGSQEKLLDRLEAKLTQVQQDQADIQERLAGHAQTGAAADVLGVGSVSADGSETERERLIRTGKITPFAAASDLPAEETTIDDAAAGPVDNFVPDSDGSEASSGDEGLMGDSTAYKDDGDLMFYQTRVRRWAKRRRAARVAALKDSNPEAVDDLPDLDHEAFMPHPTIPDINLSQRLRVPGDIHGRLFDYQKTCLRWLWELHTQKVGGIIGDEMGLGKTVQISSFLAALYYSGLLTRSRVNPDGERERLPLPSLIVCPATIMKQWVKELHTWWAPLQVAVLHATGSGRDTAGGSSDRLAGDGDNGFDSEADEEDAFQLAEQLQGRKRKRRGVVATKSTRATTQPWAEDIVRTIFRGGHIVVTTYAGVRIHRRAILGRTWGYVVLDEGHKIRNPDAEITLTCKRLRTPHRIILSGTIVQNGLVDLWSAFDFVYPGRLGTLPVFQEQFAAPISVGGFANANNYQVQTAYKCACILRDLINPYLLRRLKVDVARDLPHKQEQVLFCNLTPKQRQAYEIFLKSAEMASIFEGRRQVLFGIDIVRKICNHPDLLLLPKSSAKADTATDHSDEDATAYSLNWGDAGKSASGDPQKPPRSGASGRRNHGRAVAPPPANPTTLAGPLRSPDDPDFGDYHESGKMLVVKHLLELWEPQGHRVLLFSQTRQMLNLLETMVCKMRFRRSDPSNPAGKAISYLRMDGTTPIQKRATLLDQFNRDSGIFLFLLTTKVGGLGTNLTGADRVIIFDPDWNPSTDTQARERAWRLGQKRAVAIYRLMTAGTIEEKIYHRQIYKQFLTSKILKDPKQKRFFKSTDLRDLFSLGSEGGTGTETGSIFQGTEVSQAAATTQAKRNGKRPTTQDDVDQETEAIRNSDQVANVAPLQTAEDPSRPDTETQDANVLDHLFEMTGLKTAVRHDAILEGSHQEDILVEQEASRIADEAAAALKRSRQARGNTDVSVPTWTGFSGAAGAPVPPPRFGATRRFDQSGTQLASRSEPSYNSPAPTRPSNVPPAFERPRAADLAAPPILRENAGRPTGSGALLAGLKLRQTTLAESSAQTGRGSTFRVGRFGKQDDSHEVPLPAFRPSAAPASGPTGGFWRRDAQGPNGAAPKAPTPTASSSTAHIGAGPATQNDTDRLDFARDSAPVILGKLRDYLASVGGSASSGDIVAHYQIKMSPQEIVLFRKLLKEIADFRHGEGTSARGSWVLRSEFN
ncbi:DNA repair protein rhp26 [Tieghemiomyces parasiticus]|uniref:DNA repair protein rhp26 n=1 Tax=Tieghemiomyces parasiticus TaxID=78921 RepID=A0A9W8A542_9FUNG|nr:DNA repair protein rhp26 [Tieghemiomyces parasiticus]